MNEIVKVLDGDKPLTIGIATSIVSALSEGKTIKSIAESIGVTAWQIAQWRAKDEEFDTVCARAEEVGADILADSLLTIHDDYAAMDRAALASKNIQWVLQRRQRKKYGDSVEITNNTNISITQALSEAQTRVIDVYARELKELPDLATKQIGPKQDT